jgi:Asp-tRNA(Asn)/Glu-tRNA(Gln) amidotransferase A subunit family amidase
MTEIFETRLAPLAAALRSGQLSLSTYLEQLEVHFDTGNERIHAFLPEEGRFDRLRREAAALETHYPEPESRPALYGIPVGVKDIFHVDGYLTRAGSKLPADVLAGPEAKSVSQLKQAGVLIMGKAVTTEFAYFAPGPTRNPHNPEHTPGGSSSGSAAAVAAGLCPLALGTQTIGSIIRPASFNGTIGFKPSSGRISAEGVIPLSPTLDHIGFFTQDIAGAILAAGVLDTAWQKPPSELEHPRLAVPTGPYLQKTSSEGLEHFQATRKKLEQAGFEIKETEVMEDFDRIFDWHNALMAGEVALVHEAWFSGHSHHYHPKTTALIERGQQVLSDQMSIYKAGREQLRNALEELMAEQNISVWIAPSSVGAAPAGIDSTGDPVMNLPWTYAGLPAVNLPSGFAKNGLPLGLQLVGGWQQDEKLLPWAGQIAKALG